MHRHFLRPSLRYFGIHLTMTSLHRARVVSIVRENVTIRPRPTFLLEYVRLGACFCVDEIEIVVELLFEKLLQPGYHIPNHVQDS